MSDEVEAKYLYAWFWSFNASGYVLTCVAEQNRRLGTRYFSTFDDAKASLMQHLQRCIDDTLYELKRRQTDLEFFEAQLKEANESTILITENEAELI